MRLENGSYVTSDENHAAFDEVDFLVNKKDSDDDHNVECVSAPP